MKINRIRWKSLLSSAAMSTGLIVAAGCPSDDVPSASSGYSGGDSSTGASTGTGTATMGTVDSTGNGTGNGTGNSTDSSGDTSGSSGDTSGSSGDTSGSSGDTSGSSGGTSGSSGDTSGTGSTGPGETCGNDVVEGMEACDGTDLAAQDCPSQGFDAGALACQGDCTFDLSGCFDFSCGNDVVEGMEACDGTDLAGQGCVSLGFDAGTLACLGNCTFDTSGCFDFSCGNDVVEGIEACDGADLLGQSCNLLGFNGGVLACMGDCSAFDTSGCFDFAGDCCAANGSPGCDDAGCTAAICAANPSCCNTTWDAACAASAVFELACQGVGGSCPACGDGSVEGTEVCDGADLVGETCSSLGFDDGTLACAGDCSGFDTSGCYDYGGDCCANNGTPGCDDAACTAAICATDPSCCNAAWDATCAASAVLEPTCQDVGGSCPACGNDVTEGTEVCDGTDLGGASCIAMGFDGGTLGCQPDCSALDASTCQDIGFGDCVNNPPGAACLPQEQCITDLAIPPTVGVCTDPACVTVADCPLAQPGGTAPVACIDVTGEGINECVMFCGLPGAICPPGMTCQLGIACAWPAP